MFGVYFLYTYCPHYNVNFNRNISLNVIYFDGVCKCSTVTGDSWIALYISVSLHQILNDSELQELQLLWNITVTDSCTICYPVRFCWPVHSFLHTATHMHTTLQLYYGYFKKIEGKKLVWNSLWIMVIGFYQLNFKHS